MAVILKRAAVSLRVWIRRTRKVLSSQAVAAVSVGFLVLAAVGCGASGHTPPLSRRTIARHRLEVIAVRMTPPRFSSKDSIRFRNIQYDLIIANPGYPHAFTADQIVLQELTVRPDSSARLREEVLRSPRFVSKIDRREWQAAGRPSVASPTDRAGESVLRRLPPGAWTFTPQGRGLTFEQVRALPTRWRALRTELGLLIGATGAAPPPPALSLRQYGFLLAAAPLTRAARKAILEAVARLPGIHMCGALFSGSSSHGNAFCIDGSPTGTEILLNPRIGVAAVVRDRLDKQTPQYPNMTVGTLVDSYTFSLQPSAS